ncbi:MAG: response regulator transcription factor [Lachnospiraceae bacterium]|nr:response regulator transcription factor [Lachnospiraceae bacterium]
MKIAICEDEEIYRKLIAQKAAAFFSKRLHENEYVIHCYKDGIDLIGEMTKDADYDLILMDIQMPRSDGMEISARIRALNNDAAIIFITGLKDRAPEGYRIAAFDYILKDELETGLDPALERFLEYRESKSIAFTTDEGEMVVLATDEVLWVESERRGTKIVAESGEYYCPWAIGRFTSLLPENKFVEVFKSVFVQVKKIKRIGTDMVYMAGGAELPLARRKRKAVMSEVLRIIKQ